MEGDWLDPTYIVSWYTHRKAYSVASWLDDIFVFKRIRRRIIVPEPDFDSITNTRAVAASFAHIQDSLLLLRNKSEFCNSLHDRLIFTMRSYLISPMAVGLEFRLGWGCELSRPMQYAECSGICSLSHEPHPAGASSGLRSEFRRNKSKRRLLRALTCSNH